MRWLGALLVLSASIWIGLSRVIALRKEICLSEKLIRLLGFVQRELEQRGTPLPEVVRRARDLQLLDEAFAEQFAEKLSAGETAAKAAKAAKAALKTLPAEHAGVLGTLCSLLGRYDSRTQAKACEQAQAELEALRQQRVTELAEKGKMYGMVPITLGVMTILLLF